MNISENNKVCKFEEENIKTSTLSTTLSTIRDENMDKFIFSLVSDDNSTENDEITKTTTTRTNQLDPIQLKMLASCYKINKIESKENEKTETTTKEKVESTTDTSCLLNCNSW